MCYGIGCEFEDAFGECQKPHGVECPQRFDENGGEEEDWFAILRRVRSEEEC